jgi:hypothetical protein
LLQLNEIVLHDVKQWREVAHLNLADENKSLNTFISAYMGSKLEKDIFEVEKDLSKLVYPIKKFDHVKIELNFHFFNVLWNNNTAYIMINDHIYWLDHHIWKESSCNADKWNHSIRFVHKILSNEIKLKIGLKLNNELKEKMKEMIHCDQALKVINENMIITFDNLTIFVK